MNHWLLVGLDILVVVKYLAPFIGSYLIIFVFKASEVCTPDEQYKLILPFVIAVVLYVWGMK